MSKLVVVGISHTVAPVEVRERVAFDAEASAEVARQLAPAVCLSTCNRTELYLEGADAGSARAALGDLPGVYELEDDAAALHLFRVAAGLDSLVPGEGEILGQVRSAFEAGTPGPLLDRAFRQALHAGKRVRHETGIAESPSSVASAAAALAQQVFGDLAGRRALLIGAGKTAEQAADNLRSRGAELVVANRTAEKGDISLDEIPAQLERADIVVSATAAADFVLRREDVGRRSRPLLAIDLAVPRDIDPGVAKLSDAYLYTVDDLEQAIEENRASRREAAQQAEAIIELQVEHYMAWWRAQGRQDALRKLRNDAASQREQLLARAREQIAGGEPADAVLERLARQLTNKLLHAPSAALRQAALDGDADLLRAAERLYANTNTGSTDDTGPAP
jgi:glutamyl-tRNA reductase